MRISTKDWLDYVGRLSKLNDTAGKLMQSYVAKNGFADTQGIIDYAYGLITKYGEGSAALAAEMYDETAALSGVVVPPAEVAETASHNEVAKAVQGTIKQSQNPNSLGSTVSRLVKRAGADTTLKNARRDHAQFAWVPMGDTCPFCLTLASRGFQFISKKSLRKGHAEHIHANCDCAYTVRFDSDSGVKGYDPDKYLDMYNSAEGKSSKDKINAMRREYYQLNKDRINAQKRANYAFKQTGGKITGGHRYEIDPFAPEKEKAAAKKYEEISRYDDSSIIAKNTGFSKKEIQEIRSHVFYKKHDLDEGYKRFDPDYDMAVAWQRLKSGEYLPRDVTLLNHELLESRIETDYNVNAREAHKRAQKRFNWYKQLMKETKGKGEDNGLL